MKLHFTRWKYAGLICLTWGYEEEWNLHFLIQPKCWEWGYSCFWYDGPWRSFGFGPVALVVWRWWSCWGLFPESKD